MLAAEAVFLWIGLGWLVTSIRAIEFTTLLPLPTYPIAIVVSLVFSMGALFRMEAHVLSPSWTESLRLAFRQTFAVACAVFALAVGLKDPGISRIFLAVYLSATGVCFVVLNRYQPEWIARLLYGRDTRLATLVIGQRELFPHFDEWLAVRAKFGLEPIGVVSYRGRAPEVPGLPVVGDFENLKAVIGSTGARQILMLNLPATAEDSEHLARICAGAGCRLLIHNNVTFRLTYPLRALMQDGYSFLAFQDEPLEDPVNRFLKRTLDIVLAIPVVVFILPPLALVVFAMQRFQSPGALFYRQVRSGRGGKTFDILKFRTMRPDVELGGGAGERIYSFGRFLRRTSLDELPQFINVLRGDMSVVGPRPHFVHHDHLFADAVNEYRVRFFVKPGITGLAQSHGLRGEVSTPDLLQARLQLDLTYIHNWSVWLDLTIIARTARQIVDPPESAR